jgi:hypothetical protein
VRITLDNTCLLSLERKDDGYQDIEALVDFHPKKITLCIPAIAASENQKGGTVNSNFGHFQQFLQKIGCENCELLNPMAYLDICYLNHAVFVDEEMALLEQRIHEILFPQIPFLYSDNPSTSSHRWRNAKCDVQAMWCHIWYKGEIFVTQDRNYRKISKIDKLIDLGAKRILTPADCLNALSVHPT